MNGKTLKKAALCMALSACIASMAPIAMAQSVTGSVVGRASAGEVVTIKNAQTGLTRSVTASSDGNYRLSQLPVGEYTVQAGSGQPVNVTVALGSASTVNLSGDGAVQLAAIQVVGTGAMNMVDVTSTETSMNITTEELSRLPVDRNVASVALLAPGVTKGDSALGGISFSGSSVAENAFYVNGLNVTDFYNRNGFSEAPFSFYQEFQVKTGGYSVEFGRTTGGVVNAIAKSGSNEFKAGAEVTLEPRGWQANGDDHYFDGERYLTTSRDNYSSNKLDIWASGALIKDRLFFFALYETRDYKPTSTDDAGTSLNKTESDDGFWGGTLDWYITDNNILSLVAFSDKNSSVGEVYGGYDFDTYETGQKTNEIYSDSGGDNWALSWTSNFTDNLSMKLMYGENERNAFNRSLLDLECNRVVAANGVPRPTGIRQGCSTNSSVFKRNDLREQSRADFEWNLGDHLLRFGYDHEVNTSEHSQYYAGPGALYYNVYSGGAGTSIPNPPGGVVPAGYSGYVRARRNEISGNFESTNSAYYLEDNWSVTDTLVLNLGIRNESFDNKGGDGKTYIKMDNMWAPRFGFAWDAKGDGTTKLFGNVGRYFLPVANVINIKQAGGLLDERTYYAFNGWEIRELNGSEYLFPRLGPQIGTVDVSQGDGTVGDLRSEVDRDMDPVYQDEAILGFQMMIDAQWSWGVSGIYRRLHDAIDDMEISATGQCGEDGYVGWVMANPGQNVSVWGDTDCNGTMGWVTVDTSKEGWALYNADGDYVGQRGWVTPKRTYKAVELQLDRAWDDKWAFNASYTWSKSEGNAEGPVNSDTNFGDTGRTENFDDPWVNLNGEGPLANDREHQIKLRGTYAFNENWQVAGTVDAQSGGPITGFGVGNPYDPTKYHSYYVCVSNCDDDATAVYQHSARGAYGRMPWTYDVGASLTYLQSFETAELRVKFAVYNVLNEQRRVSVDQDLQPSVGVDDDGNTLYNSFFGQGDRYQSPRYAQLIVTLAF